jgi:hypothetical protein
MPTTIILRRGTAAPTQASGLTLGEPAFNTTDQTLHIGRGAGVTAAWVGARITGLSADIASGLTLQIPTSAAVKNYVTDYVATNTSGVASLNSLTGALTLVGGSNIGVSSASGSLTVTNNGVRTLGLSGDWKKSVVAIFGGSTGSLLLSGATWGSTTVTNAGTVGGIANGTNLAGKTVFDILESLLFTYQNVSFASSSITSGTFTTGNLELGQTAAASGNYTFSWTVNNNSNVDSTGMTVIYTGGGGVGSGSVIGATAYLPTTGRVGNLGINARGFTIGSSFSMTAQASQWTAYQAAGGASIPSNISTGATATSSLGTATWYSKIYYGYTSGASITNQSQLVTTGMGQSDRLITSTSAALSFANGSGTTLAFTPSQASGGGLQYLYVLVHNYYNTISSWKDASSGFGFGMTGNGGAVLGATLSITNTQGFAAAYKVYRSAEPTDTTYVALYAD